MNNSNINNEENTSTNSVKTKKISIKKKASTINNSIVIDSMDQPELKNENIVVTKPEKKQKVKKPLQKSLNNDLCFNMKKMNLDEHSNVEIKMHTKKTIINEFPLEGPELISLDFDRLLKLYYVKDHKYIGLRTINNETHPVFFTLLSSDWNENNEIPCQFVKHTTWEDDSGDYHVEPEWNELWKIGLLDKKFIYNCIPFDESRDYYYSIE